jgi:GNAT superfamily N-acetyltransferase
MPPENAAASLTIHPLTPERWSDFESLFGANGACGGCWCMAWRTASPKAFDAAKGEGNKRAIRRIVKAGPPPGLLAYEGTEPIGWCAVAPREAYARLRGSRILAPVDDQAVWSVTCFFVRRDRRHRGVTVALLKEAARHVARLGGRVVEGYPTETDQEQPGAFVWHGLASAFRKAGFREVARRSRRRPIMRRKAAR